MTARQLDAIKAAIPLIALANEARCFRDCAAPMVGERTLAMLERLASKPDTEPGPDVPELLDAIDACIPDLDHYAQTHGPGPDRRLGILQRALRMVRHATSVEDIKILLTELPQLELIDALRSSGYTDDPRDA